MLTMLILYHVLHAKTTCEFAITGWGCVKRVAVEWVSGWQA